MQKYRTKNHRDTKINSNKPIGYYLPIIFIIVVIPLITYGKIIELNVEESNFWRGGAIHVDFYNYYKAIAIVVATVSLSLAYGGLFLNNRLPLLKENKYYLSMMIYVVMAILSTIIAHNRHIALFGFIEMNQGIFVLISYIVIAFIIMNYIRQEKDIRVIVYSFAIITVLEGIIGLSQYFGFDLLQSNVGKALIASNEIASASIKFTFGKYTIYGTMYNTNFVGSFGALILPITTILYLHEKDKRKFIIFGIIALLAFATWLGCNSRAGYLGITAAFIIGIIIGRKIIKRHYKKILILFTGFIAITIIFNTVSGGRIFNQFSRLNPVTEAEKIQGINAQRQIKFKEVSITDNVFTVKTDKETLIGVIENEILAFKDENGNKLGVSIDEEGKISLIDEQYSGYNFIMYEDKPSYIKSDIYGRNWDLYMVDGAEFRVISFNNKLTIPIEAPRLKLLDGKETFASNRGYIWSRTIPMLKDTLIIGYGPDNYPMVFPQEDYVGRFNVGNKGMLDIVIDKPHNMYLQTAINTGVISLLALLAIWGIYLFDSLKIYINGNMETFIEYMGAAIFLGIAAYLVAGLFNDSIVSVAPLFWVLLGTGIGINRMIKTQN